MADKEVVIKLLADVDDIKKKLGKFNKDFKKNTDESKNSVNRLGSSLARIGKLAILTLLAKKAFDLGKTMVKVAGDFEQWNVAFSTMLGSADKASKLLGEIKDFAATTPFQLPQVIQGSKKLLAFGFAQDEIIDRFKVLGNIAAGVGTEALPSLILALGKVKAKGKASMEELNIILERGVPILDELAKGYGVSQAELIKMVSLGKVGFNEVNTALTNLGSGTGKFAGLMIAQSKTIGGVFSNIQDNITQLFMEIGTAMLPIVKLIAIKLLEGLNKIRRWVTDNREQIHTFFVNTWKVMKVVGKIIMFLVDVVIVLVKALIGLGKFLIKVGKAIGNIIKVFVKWNKVIFQTGKLLFFILTGQISKIKGAWDDLKDEIAKPVPMGDLEPAKKTGGKFGGAGASGDVPLPVSANKPQVQAAAKQAAGEYTDSFAGAVAENEDAFVILGQELGNNIMVGILESMFEPINDMLQVVERFFKDLFVKHLQFSKVFKTVWEGMGSVFKGIWDGLSAVVSTALNFIFSENKKAAMGSAIAWANSAAVGAAQAMASIPIVGPALAAGAYLSTLALLIGPALAIGALSFADGGLVPKGEGITKALSPNELVVPEKFTDLIRSGDLALSGGGGGGGYVINVSLEGASFNGTFDDETAFGIGEQIALGIQNNIVAPFPTGGA